MTRLTRISALIFVARTSLPAHAAGAEDEQKQVEKLLEVVSFLCNVSDELEPKTSRAAVALHDLREAKARLA